MDVEEPATTPGGHLLVWMLVTPVLVLIYRSFAVLPRFQLFAAGVVSLVLEAIPFLLLGAFAAASVRTFLPAGILTRISRRLGIWGIPVAALSGIVAPVCECAIVPTVAGLRERGLSMPYAMTLLVAVPLLNPVVFISTLAAFPGRHDLVVARFAGGYVVAILAGFTFSLLEHFDPEGGDISSLPQGEAPGIVPVASASVSVVGRLRGIASHTFQEFLEIFGYFVAGSSLSVVLQVLMPATWIASVTASTASSILVMIVLAYLLSVCSEADAFIGKAFLPLAGSAGVVAFLIFGPMLDLKNTAMLLRVLRPRDVIVLAVVLSLAIPLLVGGFVFWGVL